MVQIIPARNEWADAFKEASNNVAHEWSKGHERRSDQAAIQKAIGDLGPDANPRDILNALTNTQTYSPEAKQTALKNYIGVTEFENTQNQAKEATRAAQAKEEQRIKEEDRRVKVNEAKNEIEKQKLAQAETKATREKEETEFKETKKRKEAQALAQQLNLPEEQKQALGENATTADIVGLLKEQIKPKDVKLSPIEHEIQKKYADEYVQLGKDIPKFEDNQLNIDRARELNKETSYLNAKLGLANSAELESLSYPLIEPIVKMFAPGSSPIAQQKLKDIQAKFAIKATDYRSVIDAKLKALELFNTQALKRAQDRMALIEKYNSIPPSGVLEKFDKDTETLADVMTDYDLQGEEANVPELPSASGFKGKTVTSPDGMKYYSDGLRWTKKVQ